MKTLIERFDANVRNFIENHKMIGTAETTVRNYALRLRYFRDFLLSVLIPAALAEGIEKTYISACDIKKWRDTLLHDGLKAGTVRQYMIELKVYFNYVIDPDMACDAITEGNQDGTHRNPVNDRLYPKVAAENAQPYHHVMTDDTMEKLWVNRCPAGNIRMKETWERNYAIVVLLLDSKIRNAELLSLTLSDVDFDRRELEIRRGKGNKDRIVTLSEISLTAIRLYLASGLRPAYCTENDYLFGTEAAKGEFATGGNARAGEKWHKGTSQWLSQLVERHVRNITGQEGFRTHSLRHAGSALDLNAGECLERIQAELGHASVVTTERYTDRLRSVANTYRAKEVKKQRDMWAEFNNNLLCAIG